MAIISNQKCPQYYELISHQPRLEIIHSQPIMTIFGLQECIQVFKAAKRDWFYTQVLTYILHNCTLGELFSSITNPFKQSSQYQQFFITVETTVSDKIFISENGGKLVITPISLISSFFLYSYQHSLPVQIRVDSQTLAQIQFCKPLLFLPLPLGNHLTLPRNS